MIGRELSHPVQLLRRVLVGTSALILLFISGAAVADLVFVQIDGIRGESTDKAHPGAINALSWQWGMTQSGSFHVGGGGGAGKVNIQDFTFTHYVDAASPALMHFCATGKHFEKVEVSVRSPGDKPIEYLQLVFKRVLVTSVETGGVADPGRRPVETVTLNFAEVELKYATQQRDGSKGPEIPFKWNIVENTAM